MALTIALAAAGCAQSEPDPLGPKDAGSAPDELLPPAPPDEGALADPGFVATASAPRGLVEPPAPPRADACPAGWIRRPLGEVGATCLPPPAPTCAPGARPAIDGRCRPFGATCPEDGWPAALPADAPVRYVDAAAPAGGDGSRASPFDRLALAVADAPDGATIALRVGEHAGPVEVSRQVTLLGACASGTRVTASPSDEQAVLTTLAGPVTVRELTIAAPRRGVQVGRDDPPVSATMVLDTVRFEDTVGRALSVSPQAELDATNVWVDGVTGPPDLVGLGLRVRGGTATLRDSTIEDAELGAGVVTGAQADLHQVVIRDIRAPLDGSGWGVGTADNSLLTLEEVWIEGVSEYGVFADSGLEATRVAVRGVAAVLRDSPGGPIPISHAFEAWGRTELRGVAVEDVGAPALLVPGPAARLTVEDLYIGAPRDTQTSSVLTYEGAELSLARVWLEGVEGVSVLGAGTRLDVTDLEVLSPPTSGAVIVAQGAGPVTATRLRVSGASGAVLVQDEASQLTVRGLSMTGGTIGALANAGASLEVVGARFEGTDTPFAVGPDGTSALALEDVTARDANVVVFGAVGDGRLTARRIAAEGLAEAGVWWQGARAELEDLRIAGPITNPNAAAVGLLGGQANARRLSLEGLEGAGLFVGAGVARVEDLRLTSGAEARSSFGVLVAPEGALELERAFAQGFLWGLEVSGAITARDVAVAGYRGQGFGGRGQLRLSRGRFTDGRGFGLWAQEGGALTAEDVVVQTVERTTDQGGFGVAAIGDATAEVTRARIVGTGSAGLIALEGGSITARDVSVKDGLRPDCTGDACGTELASGVFVAAGGAADVERFEISRMPTAGLHVYEGGALDAREGVVGECGVGLLVEDAGYDPERAAERVFYRMNDRASQTREAALPPVRLDPEDPPPPEPPTPPLGG